MSQSKTPKRKGYISWDEYFMGIAVLSAMRSKDPSTQVGACIVDERKRIVSMGYNGFPEGISDDDFPWDRDKPDPLDNKYMYVVHAELNAILNAKADLKGCTIYASLFPCNECAKAIIQSGIRRVVYQAEKGNERFEIASRRMFEASGVEMVRLDHVVGLKLTVDGSVK